MGHALMENRNGLAVGAQVTLEHVPKKLLDFFDIQTSDISDV